MITNNAKYGMKASTSGTTTGLIENVASQNIPIEFAEDGTFQLLPGETAIFTQPEGTVYYAEELGIGETFHQLYPRVYINETKVGDVQGVYACDPDTIENRPLVTFKNECGEYGINDLRVTKAVDDPMLENGDMFEYRVMFETAGGKMYQYTYGKYYVLDPDGKYCRYEDGVYIPVDAPQQAQVFQAGEFGTIARIPPGYTFEIRDLMAGTHFYVDEIRVNRQGVTQDAPLINSVEDNGGWVLKSKTTVQTGEPTTEMVEYLNTHDDIYSYFAQDGAGGWVNYTDKLVQQYSVLGRIQEGVNYTAHVTFTNSSNNKLTVEKEWPSDTAANSFVTSHGSVTVALFTVGENNALTMVEGSAKTITAPATSVSYTVTDPSKFVVREVAATTSGGTTTYTPVEENGVIAVSGEKTVYSADDSDTFTNTYVVTYTPGTVTTTESGAQVRTDKVNNTLPNLTVIKTNSNSTPALLSGAVFKLLKSDGTTVLADAFSSITTGADGVILDGIYLSNGTYYLEETDPPVGYNGLTELIKIDVLTANVTITTVDGTSTKSGGVFHAHAGADAYEMTISDNYLEYSFSIINEPGTLLPSTGGIGTTGFTLGGAALIFAALTLAFISRRRRDNEA